MAGPFTNSALLRLIETALTSRRLAHLQKYQKSFNAINIQKPKGISKHVITVMLSCKMFISTELFGNADFDNIASFHKFMSQVQTASSTEKNFLVQTQREYSSAL